MMQTNTPMNREDIEASLQDIADHVRNLNKIFTTRNPKREDLNTVYVAKKFLSINNNYKESFVKTIKSEVSWNMVLELYICAHENRRIDITSLCLASGFPSTTALRWLHDLVAAGVIVSHPDPVDRRRTFVSLSRDMVKEMNCFLQRHLAI